MSEPTEECPICFDDVDIIDENSERFAVKTKCCEKMIHKKCLFNCGETCPFCRSDDHGYPYREREQEVPNIFDIMSEFGPEMESITPENRESIQRLMDNFFNSITNEILAINFESHRRTPRNPRHGRRESDFIAEFFNPLSNPDTIIDSVQRYPRFPPLLHTSYTPYTPYTPFVTPEHTSFNPYGIQPRFPQVEVMLYNPHLWTSHNNTIRTLQQHNRRLRVNAIINQIREQRARAAAEEERRRRRQPRQLIARFIDWINCGLSGLFNSDLNSNNEDNSSESGSESDEEHSS